MPWYKDLYVACIYGDIIAVKRLLSKDNIESKGKFGRTPLHLAVWYGKLDIVNYLIGEGALVNAVDADLWTPLNLACYQGNEECASSLLQSGADPNALDKHTWTPLHYAVSYGYNGSERVMELLLKAGASVNVKNKSGKTPLHIATEIGHYTKAKLLFKQNPDDIQVKDNLGNNLLHMAAKENDIVVFTDLLKHGADITERNKDGNTALSLVDPEVVPRLIGISISPTESVMIERFSQMSTKKPDEKAVQQACLRLNTSWLNQEIQMEDLCLKLLENGVLEEEDSSSILEKKRGAKLVELLKILKKSNKSGTWDGLLRSLEKNKKDVALRLKVTACIYEAYSAVTSEDLEKYFNTYPQRTGPDTVDLTSQGRNITINLQKTTLEVLQKVRNSEEYYEMSAKPRGRAIILNNEEFDKGKPRDGSSLDVDNLKRLFEALEFEVVIWNNCTAEKIKENVKTECKHKAHENADAFVFIVLSHGQTGRITGTDDYPVNITRDIIDWFDGDSCPQLVGKPKVFFIQACQGSRSSTGVLPDSTETRSQPENICSDANENFTHEKADILVSYSTVPGFKAWRDPQQGSWFMRDLVINLNMYAHQLHLADILVKVRRQVSKRSNRQGFIQVPKDESTLTKHLHFLPRT